LLFTWERRRLTGRPRQWSVAQFDVMHCELRAAYQLKKVDSVLGAMQLGVRVGRMGSFAAAAGVALRRSGPNMAP
jgi:hypothetical protein